MSSIKLIEMQITFQKSDETLRKSWKLLLTGYLVALSGWATYLFINLSQKYPIGESWQVLIFHLSLSLVAPNFVLFHFLILIFLIKSGSRKAFHFYTIDYLVFLLIFVLFYQHQWSLEKISTILRMVSYLIEGLGIALFYWPLAHPQGEDSAGPQV